MRNLLRSCVEVRTAIELSFGVVSGVGPGIHVLDGVHVPQGEWAVSSMISGIFRHLRGLRPFRLNGRNDVLFVDKCIQLVCEKLTIFRTVNISSESMFHWLSDDIDRFKIKVGLRRNLQKCNT